MVWYIQQTMTVVEHGVGNCFNACVASLLEREIHEVADILPNTRGGWREQWSCWFKDQGYKLVDYYDAEYPPAGYAMATVSTERIYPDDHIKAGRPILHSVIVEDGKVVFDPFPGGSDIKQIYCYQKLEPLSYSEKQVHLLRARDGYCQHGYKADCSEC